MSFTSWFLKKLSKEDLNHYKDLIEDVLAYKLAHKDKIARFWEWKASLPEKSISPSSPSHGDIKIYKEFLINYKAEKQTLLLGSTLQLRIMLQKLGKESYILADSSYQMIDKNTEKNEIDHKKEMWLKADWLEMPLPSGHFSYVLGDLILTQISSENQEPFFKKIHTLLDTDGLYIGRMHILDQTLIFKTPQAIIADTLCDIPNTDKETLKFILVYKLRDRLRDSITQTTKPESIMEAILNYKPKSEEEKNFLRTVIRSIFKRTKENLEYVTQTESEIEASFDSYFTIIGKKYASDYEDAKYFPIYLLKKKAIFPYPVDGGDF